MDGRLYESGLNMKVAVSGKGEVGKTLIAGVLADFFVKNCYVRWVNPFLTKIMNTYALGLAFF